jgi:GNAT superfamily N-acetyltransferase
MTSSKLRQATRADIPGMSRVRYAVRENTAPVGGISEEWVRAEIEETGRGWVVDVNGEVVAFAIGNLGDGHTGSIWALFVDPLHEGRGYGRRLQDEMLAWLWAQGLQQLWLTTTPGTRAARFYEASGWRCIGAAAKGEIRFEMTRPLS